VKKRIFEASTFGEGLAKKNTAVFSLQYFFLCVRLDGRASESGNNLMANSKKATESYSRCRSDLKTNFFKMTGFSGFLLKVY
jgi:hypothetical protein